MVGKFAYSFTGETFVGSFVNRDEALSAAITSARRAVVPPTTLYVGRKITADPKASGHARSVLANMAARVREEVGSPGSGYLTGLPKARIDELDATLENAILDWLTRNELLPTFFRMEAISEHPLPTDGKQVDRAGNDEVHDLGVSDAAEVSL